ncbi:hypothetical protein [Streptomyces sp. x-80]
MLADVGWREEDGRWLVRERRVTRDDLSAAGASAGAGGRHR